MDAFVGTVLTGGNAGDLLDAHELRNKTGGSDVSCPDAWCPKGVVAHEAAGAKPWRGGSRRTPDTNAICLITQRRRDSLRQGSSGTYGSEDSYVAVRRRPPRAPPRPHSLACRGSAFSSVHFSARCCWEGISRLAGYHWGCRGGPRVSSCAHAQPLLIVKRSTTQGDDEDGGDFLDMVGPGGGGLPGQARSRSAPPLCSVRCACAHCGCIQLSGGGAREGAERRGPRPPSLARSFLSGHIDIPPEERPAEGGRGG